jgi:hypothetical protein
MQKIMHLSTECSLNAGISKTEACKTDCMNILLMHYESTLISNNLSILIIRKYTLDETSN